MTKVFMTDPVTGRVGFFLENGTSGGQFDPAALRNAPLRDPFDHFGSIMLHSDCDMFEVALAGSGTINHAAIAGIAAPSGFSVAYGADAGSDSNVLVAHDLGYPPLALVAVGNNILWPGMPVQTLGDGSGGARYAAASVDDTNLTISTVATIGATNLPAVSITYSYLIFKQPPAASGNVLFEFDPATGIVNFGLGKVSTDRRYLQVVSGGSPLGLSFGETIDLANGAPKAWNPDGSAYEPVPAGLEAYLIRHAYDTDYAPVPGASMAYNGSGTGPATAVQVQAP